MRHPTIGGWRILFTASIIKASKSSGFSSGPIPSFSGLVVFSLTVRLHPWFLEIVRRGTGKEFATSDNDRPS
jgi:hypothetical protein